MEELCPVMTKFTDAEQMLYNKATQIEKPSTIISHKHKSTIKGYS
jgi:hypothetical protein